MSRPKTAFVAVLALLFVGLLAGAASAHVSVSSPSAQQGAYGKITFRMPTESETANSVALQVSFPPDTPFAYVGVKPHPGWDYALIKGRLPKPVTTDDGAQVTEAVTGVRWTATAGGVKPGEFDEFDLVVGPLPQTDSLQFQAVQTYSDKTVVRWDEKPGPDGAEPEHPAPTLTLTPAGATGAAATTPAGATATSETADDGSGSSTTLAVVALVVGVLGLLAGAAALLTARRSAAGVGR